MILTGGLGGEFHGDITAILLLAVDAVEEVVVEDHNVAELDLDRVAGQFGTRHAKDAEAGFLFLRLQGQEMSVEGRMVGSGDEAQSAIVFLHRLEIYHDFYAGVVEIYLADAVAVPLVVVGLVETAFIALRTAPDKTGAQQLFNGLVNAVVFGQLRQ